MAYNYFTCSEAMAKPRSYKEDFQSLPDIASFSEQYTTGRGSKASENEKGSYKSQRLEYIIINSNFLFFPVIFLS